ncbi:MAG: hypothetical protein JWQ32_958 [Marmoricola sp.]|nr:hypothetical protein [Marmoricola sp.]
MTPLATSLVAAVALDPEAAARLRDVSADLVG